MQPHSSVRRIKTAPQSKGDAAVTTYHVTLRDRETQTVVGYYNGAWTTDRCRALTLRRREAAEVHATRMRDCCPRNADLIKVEETAADDLSFSTSGETTHTRGNAARASDAVSITAGRVTTSKVVPATGAQPCRGPNFGPKRAGRRRETQGRKLAGGAATLVAE